MNERVIMKKIQVTDNFIKHAKEYAEDILYIINECTDGYNKKTSNLLLAAGSLSNMKFISALVCLNIKFPP